jgi:hypothetical protein
LRDHYDTGLNKFYLILVDLFLIVYTLFGMVSV